jgi:MATE family multidrug resistance protein
MVLFVARKRWGYIFNDDPEVVKLVAEVMPYCAIFQVLQPELLIQMFDAIASVEGGILRGQGRQHLGGIANVIVYWFIALPAGLALAFEADWGLYGLWAGMVCLYEY